MPHHLLRDRYIGVDLPVVHLELEPDEVGQNCCAARLRFYRVCTLAGFGGDDGEAVGGDWARVSGWKLIDRLLGRRIWERRGWLGRVGCLRLETRLTGRCLDLQREAINQTFLYSGKGRYDITFPYRTRQQGSRSLHG